MKQILIICFVVAHGVMGQDLLEKGKDLFRHAEMSTTPDVALYKQAAQVLEEYLQTDSLDAEGHYFLGYAYDRISLPSMDFLAKLKIDYLLKSVDHFLRSIKISPVYKGESWHLSAYSKIISMWGTAALSYIVNDKPDSAKLCFRQILKNGVISSTYFDYGENLLRSLPPNSIVFSDDELETFIVYYLQLMDELRKDVTLVNIDFLSSPDYVKFIRSKYIMGTYNIGMDMSDEEVSALRPQVMKPAKITLDIPRTAVEKYEVEKKDKISKIEFTFPPFDEKNPDSTALIVTPAERIILDIIQKTKWLRDISFTLTARGRVRNLLANHLKSQGLAFRLMPFNTAEAGKSIDTELIEVLLSPPPDYFDETANFGMPFDFSSINTGEVVRDRSLYELIDNYSNLYFDLADSYLATGNVERAKIVMINFNTNLKPGEIITNYTTIYRAALLFERVGNLEDFNKMGLLAEKLALDEVANEPFSYNDEANPYDVLLDYYIKTAQHEKLVNMLQKLLNLYPDNEDLKEKLEALQIK